LSGLVLDKKESWREIRRMALVEKVVFSASVEIATTKKRSRNDNTGELPSDFGWR
jgi:hypothetical protein